MRRALFDVAALIARVVVGVIFLAHGLQKAGDLDGTSSGFAQIGVPLPQLAALFTTVVEIGAGALLIVGLLTPVAGLLLLVVTLGALFFVHWSNGVFVDDGGWELIGALSSVVILLAAAGAGRFSLDRLLFRRGNGAFDRGEASDFTDTRPFTMRGRSGGEAV